MMGKKDFKRVKVFLGLIPFIILSLFIFYFNCSKKKPTQPDRVEELFYYSGGKIYLDLSKEKIVAKLIDCDSLTRNLFIHSEPSIDSTKTPEPIPDRFFIFYVLPGTDIAQLLRRSKENPYVVIVNPVYLLKSEPEYELIATDQFAVEYKPEVSRRVIDSINSIHHIIIVDSLFGVPNDFVQKITPESEKDVLAMANFYYENYPMVYSHPDFISLIELARF